MTFYRFCHWMLRAGYHLCGILFILAALLAFTSLPARGIAWLSRDGQPLARPPQTIVVLGGGGIPSASGLMRSYRAAELHPVYPDAVYVVSLPSDEDPEQSSVGRMRDELILRGVPAGQVRMEWRGRNTREQALRIIELLGDGSAPVLLVTSPSHARRSLRVFRKAGFQQVACTSTRSQSAEADMGPLLTFRYRFWNNLMNEVEFTRELVALAVYRVRGWV